MKTVAQLFENTIGSRAQLSYKLSRTMDVGRKTIVKLGLCDYFKCFHLYLESQNSMWYFISIYIGYTYIVYYSQNHSFQLPTILRLPPNKRLQKVLFFSKFQLFISYCTYFNCFQFIIIDANRIKRLPTRNEGAVFELMLIALFVKDYKSIKLIR